MGYRDAGVVPFHTPGHKLGPGLPPELTEIMGAVAALDASDEVFDPDSGHDVEVVRRKAEMLLADAYGADWSSFLVNGTSQGIQAAFLALRISGYDGTILLPRNSHISTIQALALSGLPAKFIPPRFSPEWGIPLPPRREDIEAILQRENVSAVFLTRPDYFGLCVDISEVCHIAHGQQVPVIVDEAHGAHLGWTAGLPLSSLKLGADLVVQSPHKLLSSLTGSSWLHLRSDFISPHAVSDGLNLVTSTSPSHILLASLDAARRQVAVHGKESLARTLKLAREVRREIQAISGLRCLSETEARQLSDDFDQTKILVDVSALGLTGPEAEKWLREHCSIQVEMATPRSVLFLITIGDTEASVSHLLAALKQLVEASKSVSDGWRRQKIDTNSLLEWPLGGEHVVPVRNALLGEKEFVDFDRAEGHVAAEWLIPYPPGVPLLIPGEKITGEVVQYYRYLRQLGVSLRGLADHTGRMVRVLRGKATE